MTHLTLKDTTPLARITACMELKAASADFVSQTEKSFGGKSIIPHAGDGSLKSIAVNLFAGTLAVVRSILPIIDYALYKSVLLAIRIAVSLEKAVAGAKARQRQNDIIMKAVSPDVAKMVRVFINNVKEDPSKTVFLQRQFQIALIEKLYEISEEYDLELNVNKLAKIIIKQQVKIMKAAVKRAKMRDDNKGKLTQEEFLSSKDMLAINEDLITEIKNASSVRYDR